jgi:hypothetical protein
LGSQRWFRLLPVATAVTISAFALVEIYDTFFDFRLGRAHGLLSVGAVKLATAVGELQAEAAIVLDEDGSLGRAVIEIKNNASSEVALRRSVSGVTGSAATLVDSGGPPQPQSPPRQSLSPRAQTKAAKARALLVGRRTTMVACAFALVACIVEIVRDLEAPGRGRHGAALLTLSELVNHWCRLFPATETGNGGNNSGHLFATALQRRRVATMGVAVPAALYAAEEVLAADWRHLGAHHAAAVLATAQFTENFYRACLAIGVPRIAVPHAQIV